jgi:hypothetical protein
MPSSSSSSNNNNTDLFKSVLMRSTLVVTTNTICRATSIAGKKKKTISGDLLSGAAHAILHLSIARQESIKERLQATTFYKHLHLHFSSSSSDGLLSLPLP